MTICTFCRVPRSFASILSSRELVRCDSSSSNFPFPALDCRFILEDFSRHSFVFQLTVVCRQVLGIYPSNFCYLPWLCEAALHINSPSISLFLLRLLFDQQTFCHYGSFWRHFPRLAFHLPFSIATKHFEVVFHPLHVTFALATFDTHNI